MNSPRITEIWPQLSQKVLVDFINGTQVAGEIVRVRSERRGLLDRAVAALTGRSATENHLIHSALVEGQLTTIAWLEALQAAQADSDLALARVARAVKAHRDHAQKRDVEIDRQLARFAQTLEHLLEHQAQLRSEIDARNELQWALNDALELQDVSAFGRAFYVVDRLWWGPFGALIRHPPVGREDSIERYKREARQKISQLLSESLGTPRDSLVDVNDLILQSQLSKGPDAETIRYLASGGDIAISPLHFLAASHEPGTLPLALPRQSSVDRIAARLWSETKWTAEGRIHHEDDL
jgi:YjcZ-like protein